MLLYRVCPTEYADDPFSGMGSLLHAGRWHLQGTALAYASTESSTAALEVLMNLGSTVAARLPRTLVTAEIPDDAVLTLESRHWPDRWDDEDHLTWVQAIGTRWVAEQTSLALRVPSSALSPPPWNVLINPSHRSIDRLIIRSRERFVFPYLLLRRIEATFGNRG